MLDELHVENYALIDRIEVDFSEGLNVLSGETGAGKSILIGALSLLLGEKGDTSAIRSGTEEAKVSGVIRVDTSPEAMEWLAARGIDPEDGRVIIRRSIKTTGKGQAFIQSTPSTRADLSELTGRIFDMHGQHQHQSLLRVATHRELIDKYGGHEREADEFHRKFQQLSEKKRELQGLEQDERDRLREQDILRFAVQEIEAASLDKGEEEELERELKLLSQAEKLFSLLQGFHGDVAEGSGGGLSRIRNGISSLESIAAIDESLEDLSSRLKAAFYEIEDVAESIRQYQDGIDFSAARLEECEDRLAVIRKLEKKYGAEIADVLHYSEDSRKKLQQYENWEDTKAALTDEVAKLEKEIVARAKALSGKRKTAAESLASQIQGNLVYLGMPKAQFTIEVGRKLSESGNPICGPWGMDQPEFLISANPGEKPKPLRRIASGGEMSRIMLAIKSVLADTDTIQSLIFDEIDAGIGGEVAIAVGNHLEQLSTHKQVLCITHLATIAVHADNHIKVEKLAEGPRASTAVASISGEERVTEIARMLAGDSTGQTSRAHAEEMLAASAKRTGGKGGENR